MGLTSGCTSTRPEKDFSAADSPDQADTFESPAREREREREREIESERARERERESEREREREGERAF